MPLVSEAALVAHWAMEEGSGASAQDAVSAIGVSTDSATWGSPGAGGLPGSSAALDFSTATNPATYVSDTPGGFGGISGSGARTVAGWINTSDGGRNSIMSWGDSGGSGHLGGRSAYLLNGGVLRFEIGGGFAVGTANIADGDWHHVAISTSDDNTANTVFWVDGVLDATASFGNANTIDSIANWLSIGGAASPTGGKARFQGGVDDLRVYDHVLSQGEVQGLMVPEPSSGLLVLSSIGLLALRRRR